VRDATHVAIDELHTGVEPVHAVWFVREQRPHAPDASHAPPAAFPAQSASLAHPTHVFAAPHAGVVLEATHAAWLAAVHWTQVAVAVLQTAVAPVHAVVFVAEQAPHAPVGWQAPPDAFPAQLASLPQPTHLSPAPHTGVVLEATHASGFAAVHCTHVAVVLSQTGVDPVHAVPSVAEQTPHAPEGWHAPPEAFPVQSESLAQPTHVSPAPHTGVVLEATHAASLEAVHWTQVPVAVSQTGVDPEQAGQVLPPLLDPELPPLLDPELLPLLEPELLPLLEPELLPLLEPELLPLLEPELLPLLDPELLPLLEPELLPLLEPELLPLLEPELLPLLDPELLPLLDPELLPLLDPELLPLLDPELLPLLDPELLPLLDPELLPLLDPELLPLLDPELLPLLDPELLPLLDPELLPLLDPELLPLLDPELLPLLDPELLPLLDPELLPLLDPELLPLLDPEPLPLLDPVPPPLSVPLSSVVLGVVDEEHAVTAPSAMNEASRMVRRPKVSLPLVVVATRPGQTSGGPALTMDARRGPQCDPFAILLRSSPGAGPPRGCTMRPCRTTRTSATRWRRSSCV
jgi:hypothetical protein